MINYGVDECTRCGELVESRSRIVNGVGSGSIGLLFVGEAPGKDEDRLGEPFVGRSGELLTEKLNNHGVNRGGVRITNSVRCRPPDNRDPHTNELDNCRGYLEAEIDVFEPRVICTLGRVATKNLTGRNASMGEIVGDIQTVVIKGDRYDVVPCYHPAALLYDSSKEEVFDRVIEKVTDMAEG